MEEEINLVDYIKVIYRQKLFILILILVFLVGGFLIYLKKDAAVYSGEGFLEIGTMEICQRGTCIKFFPESVSVLKSKIEKGAYMDRTNKTNTIKKVEVVLPEDQKDLEKIRILEIKVKSSDPEAGREYLKELLDAIVKFHNQKFKKKENYFKSLIARETEKMRAIEKDKNFLSLQYLYSEHLSNINDAQLSLSSIEQTRVVKMSDKFTSERLKLIFYLGTSLILGISAGVFLAFLRDFWQRNKKEILGK